MIFTRQFSLFFNWYANTYNTWPNAIAYISCPNLLIKRGVIADYLEVSIYLFGLLGLDYKANNAFFRRMVLLNILHSSSIILNNRSVKAIAPYMFLFGKCLPAFRFNKKMTHNAPLFPVLERHVPRNRRSKFPLSIHNIITFIPELIGKPSYSLRIDPLNRNESSCPVVACWA